jgi:glycerophosphoryl diester phosphodiesterase
VTYGFAHRGGGPGPENTISTFTAALGQGASGLETDAWVTRDGAVVLDHDGLAGSRPRRPVGQLDRHELSGHVPTLDELYEACGIDFELAVDVKAPGAADAVVSVARRYAAADRIWVVAPTPALVGHLDHGHRAVTLRGNVIRSKHRATALAAARDAGVEAINARWMWWKRAIVDEVHDAGMLAFGYDAQRRSSLDRSLSIGLDAVFSDHVSRMLAAIAASGR